MTAPCCEPAVAPTGTTYLAYIDDSGNEGHNVLSAVLVPVAEWTTYLEEWKKFRWWVQRKYKVPTSEEIHSVELGSTGRRPVGGVMLSLEDRNKISESALKCFARMTQLRVITVHEEGPCGPSLYAPLLDYLEEFVAWNASHAVVWYDGVDPALESSRRGHHRAMPYSRRVLEDPHPLRSHQSHLLQLADLAAHVSFQAIRNGGPSVRGRTALRSGFPYIRDLVWPSHRCPGCGQPTFENDDDLGIRHI